MLRKLVTERSRDVLRRKRQAAESAPLPGAEERLFQQQREAGNLVATSLAEASSRTEAVTPLGFITAGRLKGG